MNRFTIGVILCLQAAAHAAQEPATYVPSRDTYVSSAVPDGTFDSGEYLSVEEDSTGTLHERLYIKFDTADLAGKTVTSAILRLRIVRENSGGGAGDNFQLFGVNSAWVDTLTWNQSQSLTIGPLVQSVPSTDYGTINDVVPPQAVDFDVAALVQGWADGATNEGIMVRLDPSGRADIRFGSKESLANPPQLIVTSTAGTPSPAPGPTPPATPAAPDTRDSENGDNSINDRCGCGTASGSPWTFIALALGLLALAAIRY